MGELLISKGADINLKAIIYQIIEIFFFIKIIYNRWKKLNNKNQTAIHLAAEKNSKDMVELLISKGADFNGKDIIYQIMITLFLMKIIENR